MCGPCAKMRPVGGNTLSFAAISTAAMPLSKDFVGMRHHLDKEKKEALSCSNADPFHACYQRCLKYLRWIFTCQVRQIRSMESQVKWDMYREERCQTEEERREEAMRHGTSNLRLIFGWKFCSLSSSWTSGFQLDLLDFFVEEGGQAVAETVNFNLLGR